MGSFLFFSQRSERIYTKQRVIVVIALHSLREIFLIMILNQKDTGAIIEDFFDYSSFGIFNNINNRGVPLRKFFLNPILTLL